MSKEIEYINEIQNELDKNPRDKWKAYWNGKCNAIRQVLTPPTAESIIKELENIHQLEVEYGENDECAYFKFKHKKDETIVFYHKTDNTITWWSDEPPFINKMCGAFFKEMK